MAAQIIDGKALANRYKETIRKRVQALRDQDRSVRLDAITEEHRVEFEETQNGQPRASWKQKEIEELPKVAGLIRQGQIQAFTTGELYAEGFRGQRFPSPRYTDIFEGCTFDTLRAPLERSKWGLGSDQFCSKEHVIAYCKSFFLTASSERVEQFIAGMRENPTFSLSPFEEKCLRRSHVFRAISKGIARTHYPDALHLWTAEENSVDVFLTHDKKFQNVIARQKIELKCKVMLPSEFLVGFFTE
ncbi:MAG: hypothetical protein IIC03_10750 [Proteobacteria bacterium]|nr:hypothetical protein [Pseudomonadota bacterium]